MEVMRQINCRGCGETGQAVWNVTQWHPDVQPIQTPVRVTGHFSICSHGNGRAIACSRCQQIHNPG